LNKQSVGHRTVAVVLIYVHYIAVEIEKIYTYASKTKPYMSDSNGNQSRLNSKRRTVLKSIGGVATAAGVGAIATPVTARDVPPEGGDSSHYGQLRAFDDNTDEGSWDFKISIQTALNYYGSASQKRNSNDYVHNHWFAVEMAANAWQKRHEDDEWEHVDPNDGSNDRWQYQLRQGYLAVDVDGPSGTSLYDLNDMGTTAFDPGRGTSSPDWDEIRDDTVDVLIDEAASAIPGAGQVLAAGRIVDALAGDYERLDPSPEKENNYRKFPMEFQGTHELPSTANAYYNFAVKTEEPCESFDITVDAQFEIDNEGEHHRQLQPASVQSTHTNSSAYKEYYIDDENNNHDC